MNIGHIEPDVEIIVLVKATGAWSWYVSEKEYWLLDHELPIVDETTLEAFLSNMAPFRVELEQLAEFTRAEIVESTDWAETSHLFPTLLVDFDGRRLASIYPEPAHFELHVPDGWAGEFRSFFAEIPDALRYWVIDGVDHYTRLVNETEGTP